MGCYGGGPQLFVDDLSELGLGPRDRVPNGHPLRAAFDRVRRALGVEEAELMMVDEVTHARITGRAVPWIVAPRALGAQPEPIQVAAMARVLTRVALGVPWIEQLPPAHARALLTGGARLAAPDYASELRDHALDEMAADYMHRLGRAASRKQKKAMTALEGDVRASRGASLAEIEALLLAIARTEFRVAFILTGDLLATLDELRAADGEYARALAIRSPTALAATLTHRLAGDTARFALSPAATTLRREAGTVWASATASRPSFASV